MSNALEEERAVLKYMLAMVEMNNQRLRDHIESMDGVVDLYISMVVDTASAILFQADRKILQIELEAGLKVEKWLRWQLSGIAGHGSRADHEDVQP